MSSLAKVIRDDVLEVAGQATIVYVYSVAPSIDLEVLPFFVTFHIFLGFHYHIKHLTT
jgi:hypothetical protein